MKNNQHITKEYIYQAAEAYFAQLKTYEELTLDDFTKYVGISRMTIYRKLPSDLWNNLRKKWCKERLMQAMDEVYTKAHTQQDFTVGLVAKYAGIPTSTAHRLIEEELKIRRAMLPVTPSKEYICQAAEAYFAQLEAYKDLTLANLANFVGISLAMLRNKLPPNLWKELRKSWCKERLMQAIEEVYSEAHTQKDFTAGLVAERAGISVSTTRQLVKEELKTHRAILSAPYNKEKLTARQKESPGEQQARVLTVLQTLVDSGIFLKDLTKKHVLILAGIKSQKIAQKPWFAEAYRNACLELIERASDFPQRENILPIPGGWVDLNSDSWDFRPSETCIFRKDQLRPDFTDVAWTLLKEELLSGNMAIGTARRYYTAFVKIGNLLGEEIPDIRQATQATMQKIWFQCSISLSHAQLSSIRIAFVHLFEKFMSISELDDKIDSEEMFRICCWLQDIVKIGKGKPKEFFFSEKEMDLIIECCLTDIATGISYAHANPNLFMAGRDSEVPKEAIVVVQWAVALIILLMAFTGLRRESLLMIKIDDWAEIRSGIYALIWRHNKKGEENIAILPDLLAQNLQLYVTATDKIRSSLKTEFVFIGRNGKHFWELLSVGQFMGRLQHFSERHQIEQKGMGIHLTSTTFRRTYATRALYEGRSLGSLQAGLGHAFLSTTLHYCKFDRYEHPAIVQNSLDEYGRRALTPWKSPLILDDLGLEERISLLGSKEKQKQDVGICRHSQCVMALQGSPPPCSLCEHLVTGPEFLNAWNAEYTWREQELQKLATEPESEMLLAQMKYLFERFKLNFTFINSRYHS